MIGLAFKLARFAFVGVAASLVHLGVVATFVPLGLSPAPANVAAFLVAFQVSYHGHRGWTFRHPGSVSAYGRMFLLALATFAFNQAGYLWMLHHACLDYRISLIVVLGVQALLTFLLAKAWVFRPS